MSLVLVGATRALGSVAQPLPPAKQAVADHIKSVQAAAQANRAPKGQVNPNPKQATTLLVPVGGTPAGVGRIYDATDTVHPPIDREDAVTNSWSVSSAAVNIDVWAGTRGADPLQGFALIVSWNADRTSVVSMVDVDAPSRGGPLSIVAASGTVLTLSDATGATLALDATTGTFR
jgi:hypothetical protein